MWTISLNEFFLLIGALSVLVAAVLVIILRGSRFSEPIPGPERSYRKSVGSDEVGPQRIQGEEERVEGILGHPNYTEALVIKEGEAFRTVAYICQDGLVVKEGFEPEIIDKNIVVFKKKD